MPEDLDPLDAIAMDQDELLESFAPRSALPQNAARAAGWGFIALLAVLGFVAWKRLRK